ncbi:MAG: TraE/TraK family type IV conjugative transfer system protein [Sulfurimonas sp.]|uniref:TraE/TraK family type IV conjugative transfer system protein n=1 Tax=Sulfurimonas sp. TaxID=2022749 RepID=UPI00262240C3|nr:TraE/TraK family type IV conjugative transfer system protein [Sulfurimonas sp.]MDD3476969.1 TraE/TraK family type IV conjugative transfer system protein [Sulfurimonas sp.]
MLFDKFKFKMDKYIYENWTFRIVTIVLLGVIIFQSYLISSRMDNQKVVFMPPKVVNQEFWVTGNEVSKSYLNEMAQFTVFNLMNVTKETAKHNIDNLLVLVSPDYYYEVKANLIEQMNYITDNAISRVFFPSVVNVDQKGLIKVTGVMKDIISDKIMKSEQAVVRIEYQIKQGRFWIYDIKITKDDK